MAKEGILKVAIHQRTEGTAEMAQSAAQQRPPMPLPITITSHLVVMV